MTNLFTMIRVNPQNKAKHVKDETKVEENDKNVQSFLLKIKGEQAAQFSKEVERRLLKSSLKCHEKDNNDVLVFNDVRRKLEDPQDKV